MKALVLTAAMILGSALAQGWTLEGKARLYDAQDADVYARVLGEGEAEIKVGTVNARGEFRLELPETPPVTPSLVSDGCEIEVTPGLRIAAIERLEVHQGEGVVGELSFASRPISSGDIGLGSRDNQGKYGFLFYANQNGTLRQACVQAREAQYANVTFQPGWNWITARVGTRNDQPALYLSSGVTNGVMRWWFVAAKPE